jgi:hypothetical protein
MVVESGKRPKRKNPKEERVKKKVGQKSYTSIVNIYAH